MRQVPRRVMLLLSLSSTWMRLLAALRRTARSKAAAGQHGLISTSRGSPKAALAAASSLAIRRRRLLQPYVDGRCKSTSKCVQSLITEKGEGLIKITLRLGRSAERTFYPCRRPLYSSPASFSAPKKFELRVRETNEEPPRNLMQQNSSVGPPGRPRARNFTPRPTHRNWPARAMPTPRRARLPLPLAEVDNCAGTRARARTATAGVGTSRNGGKFPESSMSL